MKKNILLKKQIPFLYPPTRLTDPHPPPPPSPPLETKPNRVARYLHRARLIDTIRFRLRSNPSRPPLSANQLLLIDSFIATHALRSAPSPDSALSLFQTLKTIPNFSHSQNTLHAMAKILALSGRRSDLQTILHSMNSGEYPNTLPPSSMDLIRWHAAAGDIDSTLRAWNEMRVAVPGRKHPCTESYNVLMDLYAKKGKNPEAVRIFSQMIDEGANPNSRTYTVVIEHLAMYGRLEAALEVFERLPSMRIRRTSKQYSVLAEGFSEIERFDVVKTLVKEMQIDGILPSSTMRSSLARLREAGFVAEAEEFGREFSPDERIGSLGFCLNCSDDDEEEEDGDDGGGDRNGSQLKPWLDPNALASALSDWNLSEVTKLGDAKFVWTTRLVCKLLRAFKRPETAWEFFCWVAYQPGGFTHDVFTVSRMITILARHGHVELVDRLVAKVKREGIQLSFSTVRLVVDSYGVSKKADAALGFFRDVESVFGSVSKSNYGLLYSSLLRTFVKCKRASEAMNLLEEMVLSGICPDIQTFSGLMQYFALEGDLRTVQQLFGMVRQSGTEPDAYMFQILIRAYCKRERAALALRVFEDMRNSNLFPDATTKALLVKSLWKEGKLREAASVEERTEEVKDVLPVALLGHIWTVSSTDLMRVFNIYSSSFLENGG
ncbi:pentatricopeptide repeat-containing protein At5g66631-like [Tasmannia lanceolata]|uniref:pentatricopeptide repeat-containing protein At5g66631-like n=1 Tax=Tasmannia lanceolata TaxID=3420 RepID=UPI0040633F67